jgi:hypothetical protein
MDRYFDTLGLKPGGHDRKELTPFQIRSFNAPTGRFVSLNWAVWAITY